MVKLNKDIYHLISTFIHPLNGHQLKDWNSFVRINRITAQIGRKEKEARAELFGINLELYKLQKSIEISKLKKTIEKEKRHEQHQKYKEKHLKRLYRKWDLLKPQINLVLSDKNKIRYTFYYSYYTSLSRLQSVDPNSDILDFIKEKQWEISQKSQNCVVLLDGDEYCLKIIVYNKHSCKQYLIDKLRKSGNDTYTLLFKNFKSFADIYKEIAKDFKSLYYIEEIEEYYSGIRFEPK